MEKKKHGRPKLYSSQVMFSLKAEQIDELDRICIEQNSNRSEFIRGLFLKYLEEEKKRKES